MNKLKKKLGIRSILKDTSDISEVNSIKGPIPIKASIINQYGITEIYNIIP